MSASLDLVDIVPFQKGFRMLSFESGGDGPVRYFYVARYFVRQMGHDGPLPEAGTHRLGMLSARSKLDGLW